MLGPVIKYLQCALPIRVDHSYEPEVKLILEFLIHCHCQLWRVGGLTTAEDLSHDDTDTTASLDDFGNIWSMSTSGSFINAAIKLWAWRVASAEPLKKAKLLWVKLDRNSKEMQDSMDNIAPHFVASDISWDKLHPLQKTNVIPFNWVCMFVNCFNTFIYKQPDSCLPAAVHTVTCIL